jgi:hypothetical protein
MTGVVDLDVEQWRLYQQGHFVHFFPIWDDIQQYDLSKVHLRWDLPPGFTPQHFLDIDVVTRTLTHVFRFAARFAQQMLIPDDSGVSVFVRILGTKDRVLMTWEDPARLRHCYRASAPEIENTWDCALSDLKQDPDDIARKAAHWFLERFSFHDVAQETIRRIQARIFGSP